MLKKYTLLLFLSIYIAYSSANITSIPNSQTKNLKNADLAEVQLQEVEAYQKENKLNENGERILRRKIAPTDVNLGVNNATNTGNDTVTLKIATEGSGVTKLTLTKDGLKNNTNSTAKTVVVTEHPIGIVNSTKLHVISTPASIVNGTVVEPHSNLTLPSANGTTKSTLGPQVSKNSTAINSKSTTTVSTKPSTTSTSTTTSTTTTTTTTTTPKPKKPTITYSIEDMPEIANVVPQHSSSSKLPTESKPTTPNLSVDEPEQPIAQPSQEFDSGLYRNHRDYIIPFVSIIFAVPILMGMVIVAYRRFRDFWSTRHYRRMDFLVDGMYND